jgi:hypothetical protein
MQGIIRAIARLLVMGGVMAAVLVASVVAGLGTTTAIALGILFAGLAGLVGVARRPRKSSGADEIDAMLAADPLRQAPVATPPAHPAKPAAIDAMAPPAEVEVNPEANMPRWRRPSLIEARRSDPTRGAPAYRLPMRFSGEHTDELDVRVVRYAVVPVLDRPDEVLGRQLSDLGSGDEVHVVGASNAFVEVVCPNGDRGWVHRTTLQKGGAAGLTGDMRQALNQEADDALSALLSARGLT